MFVVGSGGEAWAPPRDNVSSSPPAAAPTRPPAGATSDGSAPAMTPVLGRSAPARALLRLLRAAALTGGSRWPDLVYALLVHGLYAAAAAVCTVVSAQQTGQKMSSGATAVEAVVFTGFMGVIYVTMWLPLACCLASGRRRYRQALLSAERGLQRVTTLPAFHTAARKHRRQLVYLAIAVAVSTVYVAVICFFDQIAYGACDGLPKNCAKSIVYSSLLFSLYVGAHLIPIKYTIVGLDILTGFQTIIGELKSVCQGKQTPNGTALRKLRSMHMELSEIMADLTDIMSKELITIMFYGTLSSISVWLVLIVSIRQGAASLTGSVPHIVFYLLGAITSVVLPCELVQRILTAVSQIRQLLLKPQWQLPEMQNELGLFRETVSRDQDTLGDLGLFRLQRSTILSISATIMTYIIVLVQFYVTELTT